MTISGVDQPTDTPQPAAPQKGRRPARNTLDSLESEQVDVVLMHPRHQWAFNTVTDLIYQLRASRSDTDLYQLQRDLLAVVLDTEQRRAAVSRIRKRVRKNARDVPATAPELESGLDPHDPVSWELEYVAHERVCRQLRSVGDALAWRAFGYERSHILALSRGESAGPMAGKDGLAAELAFVDNCWREGRFALLHDLTNVLRLGDVSVFHDEVVAFHEIKTNQRYQNSAQQGRLSAVVDSLTRGTPFLRGGQTLVRMAMPYRTHLDALRAALNLAHERGMQGVKVPGGRAVMAASLYTAPNLSTQEEFGEEFSQRFRSYWRKAGIRSEDHKLVLSSLDRAGRVPTAPPWAIYPVAPEIAAGLITDSIFFYVAMSPDAVISALADHGVTAEWRQQLDGSETDSQPLLSVMLPVGNGRAQTTSMNLIELNRLLLELIDLGTWSEHLAALLRSQQDGITPWPHFPDEWKVWA
ncbi:hypothetical protein ACLQ2S_25000 [Micromonospora sp. DT48]|uniref:hypothetical protein n=1 Tax=Micromonospora sp. DT48 TaxID=3393429 RepID=UPI003CF45792